MSAYWSGVDCGHGPFPRAFLIDLAELLNSNRLTCPICQELRMSNKPHGFGFMRPARSDEIPEQARAA
jgi:hypothetical protein